MADNTAQPLDLNSVLEMFAQANKDQNAQIKAVDSASEQLGASVETELEAIIRDGQLAADVKKAQDRIILERARRNKEAAAFFGVNQEAANSIVAEMAASIQQQHGEAKRSAQEIAARMNRSFLDDPLSWIVDQFALPKDVAAHNTRVQILEADMHVLGKLGELADKQIARNNAIDANTSAVISGMEAERALNAARARAEDARQKALQLGVQFGTVRTALSQQAFSNMVQLHNAQVAVQHLELSRSSKELQESSKLLQQEQLKLLIRDREEKLEARERLQEQLDRATGILGLRKLTYADFERAPETVKRALWDVMANPSIQEGRLGYDTLDSLETAEALNAPLTPGSTEVKNVLRRWAAEKRNDPTISVMKPADRHDKIQEHIVANVKREANNIQDGSGLYSAPSIAAVDKIPVVKVTQLWKNTFEPQAAANKNIPLSAQAVYDAAVAAVTQKRMSLEQAAAEVALVYKAIAMDNSQQRDYRRFALPMQNNYRTAIDTGTGIFRGTQIIDMTNPAEVTRQLTRTLAASRALSGPNPLLGTGGQSVAP